MIIEVLTSLRQRGFPSALLDLPTHGLIIQLYFACIQDYQLAFLTTVNLYKGKAFEHKTIRIRELKVAGVL